MTSALIGNHLSISCLISVLSKRESTRKAIGDDETQYQEVQTSSFLFLMFYFFPMLKRTAQMNPCDSLQLIGHSGLRTKTKERKKSRYVYKIKQGIFSSELFMFSGMLVKISFTVT